MSMTSKILILLISIIVSLSGCATTDPYKVSKDELDKIALKGAKSLFGKSYDVKNSRLLSPQEVRAWIKSNSSLTNKMGKSVNQRINNLNSYALLVPNVVPGMERLPSGDFPRFDAVLLPPIDCRYIDPCPESAGGFFITPGDAFNSPTEGPCNGDFCENCGPCDPQIGCICTNSCGRCNPCTGCSSQSGTNCFN